MVRSKRKLTGAHYGIRDWALQRLTAVVMAAYTIFLLLGLLFIPNDYAGWQAFFSCTIVRVFTQVTALALLAHVWVGIRDVWMDYVKPLHLRLTLHTLTILWLVGTLVYSIKVIWGVA